MGSDHSKLLAVNELIGSGASFRGLVCDFRGAKRSLSATAVLLSLLLSVEAQFKKGVLTVNLPKRKEDQGRRKTIEITTE
ncbi:MAG: hypothetical protein AAB403_04790 [Planctomycetota bacterium]